MKKLLSLVCIAALAAGFAAAQDGIGLSVGLEFGIGDINKPEKDKYDTDLTTQQGPPKVVLIPVAEVLKPYLWAVVEYDSHFFDGALDVYGKLAYDVGFYQTKGLDDKVSGSGSTPGSKRYFEGAVDKGMPHNLYLDVMLGYNLMLGDASTLSFIVGSENSCALAPDMEDGIIGVVRPGIRFSQNFGDPGDFFAQTDFPVAYLRGGMEKDFVFSGLDVTLGWASTFGLGIKATGHILFTPNDKALYPDGVASIPSSMWAMLKALNMTYTEAQIKNTGMWKPASDDLPDTNGFTGISFAVTYENGPIYGEIALTTPVKKYGLLHNWFDTTPDYGMVIAPTFQYTFMPGLAAYVTITIDGLFARAEMNREVDPGITPAIGVKYSF